MRRHDVPRVAAALCLCTGLIVSISCTRTWEAGTRVPKSTSDRRIPLRAGAHLSSELRARAAVPLPTTFAGVQISLETALLTGFDRTLRAAFREVVAVPSPDVALAHQAIDVLIVPELRRVDFSTPGFGAASLLLGTDWSAIGGSGKLVWRDTITAHGADACNSKWPGKAGAPCVKRLCENVLQQLFEQVYARLVEVDWEKVASKR